MSHQLTPAEKGLRTRLLNEGIALTQQKKAVEARLKEIQHELYEKHAKPALDAGLKSCSFTSPAGSCDIVLATTIEIPEEEIGEIQEALGEQHITLIETKVRYGVTSGLRRLVEHPQPQEVDLAERLRGLLRFKPSTRFTFKAAG